MRKSSTTNLFNKGLIMDLNPLTTPNDVMTDALNATIITYNGNENALQNDMGNGRVETAYLPEGYIPLGTAELGGIIYIVSYNPQIDKCQIGCFPSPERNFTSDELGLPDVPIQDSDFVNDNNVIINELVKKRLTDFTVHPGDKFKISGESIKDNVLQLIPTNIETSKEDNVLGNVRLRLGTLDSNGQIIELDDSDLLKYTYPLDSDNPENTKTFIIQSGELSSDPDTDLDEYRKLVDANYNIYQSKVSGELYLIAKLAVINSFDVTYSVTNIQDGENSEGKKYSFTFYFNTTNDYYEFGDVILSGIYTDVDPKYDNITSKIITIPDGEESKVSDGIHNYSIQLEYDSSQGNFSGERIITYTFTPVLAVGKYSLFTTDVSINLDLIGTGVIQSTIWKYYKNPSSMNLYFNLELYPLDTETYEDLKIHFFRYNNLPGRIYNESYNPPENSPENPPKKLPNYTHPISKRKSYSGSYTEEISFNDIDKDSLYLVVFEFTISKTEGNKKTTEYKHLYRCLYTNGVFNQKYVDVDNDVLDFDTIPLEFDWTIDYTNNLKQLTLNPTISRTPNFENNEKVDFIRGEQKYEGEWEVELNPQLDVINNYNTFVVDQQMITITSEVSEKEYTREGELTNSSGTNIDPEFVSLTYSNEGDNDFSNSQVQTSVKDNIYNIKGTFYIPVSATSTLKSCTAQELFKPAISTMKELESTYGFTIANNHFSRSNLYPAVGMSNGGDDNQGGGGLYIVYGNCTYIANNNIPATASAIFPGSGIKIGSFYFPDQGFSNEINYLAPFPIVPVHLRWAGYGQLQLVAGGVKTFANDENAGKKEDARRGWFEDGSKYDQHSTLWIFMKDNNEGSANYFALNLFFAVQDAATTLVASASYTAIDILVYMLMSTFVKVTGSDQQFEIYTVDEFSYYEDVIENITSTLSFAVEIRQQNYILFNGTTLSKIKENFDEFKDTEEGFKCLTFIPYDTRNPIKVKINNKITLINTLINQYLKYYQDNPTLDRYFYNIFTNINSIELANNSSDKSIYFISEGEQYIDNNKIVLTQDPGRAKLCTILCDEHSYDNFRFKIDYGDDFIDSAKLPIPAQLFRYLTYSPRYNQVLLDKSKMSNAPSTQVYFMCHEFDNSKKEFTGFNDISIGNEFTVTNGLG